MKSLGRLLTVIILVPQIYGSLPFNGRWKRQACSSTQFKCSSGECVENFFICDGAKNCKDGSDETETVCKDIRCPNFAFRCNYGACVDADSKCNGVVNCADESDENGCNTSQSNNCNGNQFRCNSGICIDPFLLCDGIKDCDDGSDETREACGAFKCPGFAFQCDYGACIDRGGLCNGVVQCADESDEKPERCGMVTTTTTTTTPPPSFDGCILPPQPANGRYQLSGCEHPCSPQPGTQVPTAIISYTCEPGFTLSGSPYILCDNGWKSAFPTCSRVSCVPLVNPSRDIECQLNGKKVECDQNMAPGTVASVKCKTFYSHSTELMIYDTVCNADGKWSREMTSCIPNCGQPNPDGLPFVSNGVQARYGEFPWHVGIYENQNGSIQQKCGGSIVSERVLVTAAHCFWDTTTAMPIDKQNFHVVVGKYYLNWNNRTRFVQIPEIESIIMNERFKGLNRLYQNDIALVILKKPINMTDAVRPICIDYNNEYHDRYFTPGKTGIVVGWGISETMTQKETLHTATLPFVNFTTCEQAVPQEFQQFLTNDKFCAGYQNGTSVCPGDSGGGYATQFKDGKWYLVGIVSIGVRSLNADECNIYQYTTFTRVKDYYQFIRQYLTLS